MAQLRPNDGSDVSKLEGLLVQQRFAEAAELAEKLIARVPRATAGHVALGRASIATGRLSKAESALKRGLVFAPDDPQLNLLMGVVDHRLGRSAAAIDRLTKLLGKRPPNEVEVGIALAEAMHRAGRRDELDALIEGAGRWIDDERASVFAARSLVRRDRQGAIARLVDVARGTKNPLLKRIAGFEAIRLLDADARYQEAFDLAVFVHRETTPIFDVGAIEADIGEQMRLLSKGRPWFTPKAPAVDGTALVVGMPRSGTTLLEQMLDRHPRIAGIGEYEGVFAVQESLVGLGLWPGGLGQLRGEDAARLQAEYLEGARARRRMGADWTFDKTLHAWRMLPAVAAVLPGAALVHIARDPRDMAISMFLSNFHPRSWGFTANLAAIRRMVELERAVVSKAAEVLGLRTVSLRYEELVDAPEREMRRVLALMGLEFDPVVLAPEANTRTVLTLSYEQVRRSINRSSIGRWRNYAFAFDGSWDALA